MHINMTIPELQVTTHFSFLRGASSPEELFSAAALLGIPSLGVTDHGSLAGSVPALAGRAVEARTRARRAAAGRRMVKTSLRNHFPERSKF